MSWILGFFVIIGVLAYHRASLFGYLGGVALLLALMTYLCGLTFVIAIWWLIFLGVAGLLSVRIWRFRYLTSPLLTFYKSIMPSMSATEREAITAGTVTFEAELFCGKPNWRKFLALPAPKLTDEEQAFIDGPVNALCQIINDWEISYQNADLSPAIWQFLKEQGFFGLIIPKSYGGKQFSAFAHSQIIIKINGLSVTASTIISVPNSLGPAELLLHYGTPAQKDYYLPRLARGEEIPCFALTSPDAGSDAGAMTDYGIVCRGEYAGETILGIRLNWDKRYITLAPIATVIGLAFKLYDPDHLLGTKIEIGITCALVPRNTQGVTIGRRHVPLYAPFQNGPTQGHDVFIPLDWIIGGVAQAGKGWQMLMECLAAGRAITLPSSALGGAKIACYTAGAYGAIRKQFNVAIGKFEGVEEALARIGAYTYLMDAMRKLAISAIDLGAKPAVASAIVKYHTTEFGRKVSMDTMDIHGGKAICLGPSNYIARGFVASPIAITVEGANILTRNMIIFGQGAIRCHPYVLAELEAANLPDAKMALRAFDRAVIKHIFFGISNVVRSFFLGLTNARFVTVPNRNDDIKKYYQMVTRFSAAFALIADVSMLSMGGSLKRKENLSARLGDILSFLYIMSAALKQYHDQGEQQDDLPLVQYAMEYCLFEIQDRFDGIFKNYPNRWLARLLKVLIFPLGMSFSKPSDEFNQQIATLLMTPSSARQRLAAGAYLATHKDNLFADVQDALIKTMMAEPVEKLVKAAKQSGKVTGYRFAEYAQSARDKNLITPEQFDILMQAETARKKIIRVDDFASSELTKRSHAESIY